MDNEKVADFVLKMDLLSDLLTRYLDNFENDLLWAGSVQKRIKLEIRIILDDLRKTVSVEKLDELANMFNNEHLQGVYYHRGGDLKINKEPLLVDCLAFLHSLDEHIGYLHSLHSSTKFTFALELEQMRYDAIRVISSLEENLSKEDQKIIEDKANVLLKEFTDSVFDQTPAEITYNDGK